jgi:hypothetical protein
MDLRPPIPAEDVAVADVLVALDAVDRESDVGQRHAVEIVIPGAAGQLVGQRGELAAVPDIVQVGRDLRQRGLADQLQLPGIAGKSGEVLDG